MSGFLCGHSYCTALVKMVNGWRLALDSRKVTGSIAIGLSKDFDSTCHNLLLAKLHASEVCEEAIDFLHSFLTGRKQRVCRFTEFFQIGYRCIVMFFKAASWGHSCLRCSSTI